MINCKEFYDLLTERGVEFFTGVPDSLLKDFCAYIEDNSTNHIITANEGNAIALATGYHLSTGKIPLVYMQNSGLGNAINPLTSLTDSEIYNIPILLIIGWRGEPGTKDEPQHIKQGKITLGLLGELGISGEIMSNSIEDLEKSLDSIWGINSPHALVVRKGIFEPYKLQKEVKTNYELSREDAIRLIVDNLNPQDVIVSTTGKTSRELFEYREFSGHYHNKDFLTVGSMGHSSSIALGIALQKLERDVYCLDGDGALIMHMGSLAIIGQQKPKNFKHIVFNNGCHESIGGQPTAGFDIDFTKIAEACGYKLALKAETEKEVKIGIDALKLLNHGPGLLEIRVKKGSRPDLRRPTTTPIENKKAFMDFLNFSEL